MQVPFITCHEMLAYNENKNLSLWELAVAYEAERGNISASEVFEKMRQIVHIMGNAIHTGLKGTTYHDRILGPQSLPVSYTHLDVYKRQQGIPITGTETYGGPVVTASGLIFIASTRDERIRAFDKTNGKVIWEYQLPAGGFATPISYEVNGKQYIALAVGGGRGAKPGGWYMGFALK